MRETGISQELLPVLFSFYSSRRARKFLPSHQLWDMSRDIGVHLPPGVKALDRSVVSTFCKEIGFTGGLSAGCTTAH